ncbi:MAG: DUF6326 family protein [Bacteroidales bacterium]
MGTKIKSTGMLSNTEINVKIKLSALWITIMFLFVYADLKAIYQTGTVGAIIKGEIIGLKIDQIFLLSSAILMSIPAIMIFLSLILKPKINRTINIIFATLFIIVNTGTYFTPGKLWYYYIYFTTIEYVISILIIWTAWKWPKNEL